MDSLGAGILANATRTWSSMITNQLIGPICKSRECTSLCRVVVLRWLMSFKCCIQLAKTFQTILFHYISLTHYISFSSTSFGSCWASTPFLSTRRKKLRTGRRDAAPVRVPRPHPDPQAGVKAQHSKYAGSARCVPVTALTSARR